MHKRFFFLFVFMLFAYADMKAQTFASEVWHDGEIVLAGEDTLRGLIKYDLQNDLVQLIIGDKKAEVYTARKVVSFQLYDASVKRYRNFYALPFNVNGGYKAPVFFELLEEGKLTALSRETLETRSFSSPGYIGSYTRVVEVYRYYFLKENGDIEEFVGTKNDLLNMMGKKGDQVEKYMRRNKLRFDEKYDFAKIIEYYNTLVAPQ